MAGENLKKKKKSTLAGKQPMAKASLPDLFFSPLLWFCSCLEMLFFNSGLESELQLFVFGNCCNLQLIALSVHSIPHL